MLVDLVNLAVAASLGQEATMNEFERGLIEPSLGNILSRASDAAVERFLGFSDVLMLGAGVAMWYHRLRQIKPPQTEEETPRVEEIQVVTDNEWVKPYEPFHVAGAG